jgi:hypothetical protein
MPKGAKGAKSAKGAKGVRVVFGGNRLAIANTAISTVEIHVTRAAYIRIRLRDWKLVGAAAKR